MTADNGLTGTAPEAARGIPVEIEPEYLPATLLGRNRLDEFPTEEAHRVTSPARRSDRAVSPHWPQNMKKPQVTASESWG